MRNTLDVQQYQADAARDDLRDEREGGKCPGGDVRWPRFTYCVRGFDNRQGWTTYKRVMRDERTGQEKAFEMNEVNETWAWMDGILEAEKKGSVAA